MLYHLNHPHFKMFTGSEQKPQRFERMDIGDFMDSIVSAATQAEQWIPAHLQPKFATATKKPRKSGSDDEKFEVKVDVTNFKQEELTLRVVDNSLLVEAKHEEKEDNNGFISRQFTRRFPLPEGVVLEKMICKMISDNIILISAPIVIAKPPSNERTIPIKFIGQTDMEQQQTVTPEIPVTSTSNESNDTVVTE